MRGERWVVIAALLMASAVPAAAARGLLNVEVWTDRENGAVYQPGDAMEVRTRVSDDAYLLVYELDSEGRVNLLFPDQGSRGWVEGRQTLYVPSDQSNLELVVEGSAGEGFVVAIASTEPFLDLPWYLRPYDMRAVDIGYEGDPDDEEGITSDGRIVGDPFVAMERIRRRVLSDPDDSDRFATAYTTYYVHHRVKYPRYLCNDCHRPNRWAWWDGFDPYYSTCSVFDFRVNWHWGWGPGYWFGSVPYYVYVYRPDCPPRYRVFSSRSVHYSSWDGWRRWDNMWGGNLRRYKSAPPADYVPPSRYKERNAGLPPGFLPPKTVAKGRHESGGSGLMPVRRDRGAVSADRGAPRVRERADSPRRTWSILREPRSSERRGEERARVEESRRGFRLPRGRSESEPRAESRREARRAEPQREEKRTESRREERRAEPAPRVESRRESRRSQPTPRYESRREERRSELVPRFERREEPNVEFIPRFESRSEERRSDPTPVFESRREERRPEFAPRFEPRREERRAEPAPRFEPRREERRAEPNRERGKESGGSETREKRSDRRSRG